MSDLSDNTVFDFNFNKKLPHSFSKNPLINLDFCNYLKFLNEKDFTSLGVLMDKLYFKTRIFYQDKDYNEIFNLINAFLKIRKFYFKIRYPNYNKLIDVNDFSLSLVPTNEVNDIISLKVGKNNYRFSANEILTIYKFSLNSVDSSFYNDPHLSPPENPYTNVPFTLKENIVLFNKLKFHLIKKAKNVPDFLMSYMESYFDIRLYKTLNLNKLCLISVNKYVNEMNNREFYSEFCEMIDTGPIKEVYCKHCYQKYDLKKIFKKTMALFLLNCNDIYVFGYFIRDFLRIAKAQNMIYDDEHRYAHKMSIRKKRQRKSGQPTRRRRLNRNNSTTLNQITNNINTRSAIENLVENTYNNDLSSINIVNLPI